MSRFAGFNPQIRLRTGGGRPSPDRRHWVIRPLDLLVLGFDLVGLRVVPGEGEGPARLAKDGRGEARLVVWFPPQHLTERAYFTTKDPDGKPMEPPTQVLDENGVPVAPDPAAGDESPDDPPIDAIVAGWSRLVFRVGDDRLPIDWTLEGLLAAMGALELSVPANALPPKKPGRLLGSLLEQGAFGTDVVIASQTGAIGSAFAEAGTEAAAVEVVGSVTARLIAGSRAKRKARTIGNALGLTTLTGSATRELIDRLDPSIPAILLRPEPAPPTATQTALELPYRLILSPNRFGAWFHRDQPATSERTGHTELWHTRLGVRHEDGTLIDGDDPLRTLRAVWALDPPMPSQAAARDPRPRHRPVADVARRVRPAQRHAPVVELPAEDGNVDGRPYEPNPLDVRLLALTSLGAWLDTRGRLAVPAADRARGRGVASPGDARARPLRPRRLRRVPVSVRPPRVGDQDHRAPVPRRSGR